MVDRVARPEPSVIALPTLLPFREKLTDLPATPTLFAVRVAERSTVPPKVPVAGATTRVDTGMSLKHTVTSCRLTVAVLSVVLSDA